MHTDGPGGGAADQVKNESGAVLQAAAEGVAELRGRVDRSLSGADSSQQLGSPDFKARSSLYLQARRRTLDLHPRCPSLLHPLHPLCIHVCLCLSVPPYLSGSLWLFLPPSRSPLSLTLTHRPLRTRRTPSLASTGTGW